MREIKRRRFGVSDQSLAKSSSSNVYVDSAESAKDFETVTFCEASTGLVETLHFDVASGTSCKDMLRCVRNPVAGFGSPTDGRYDDPSAVIRCLMHSICILSYALLLAISVALRNPGFTAGRGFNPAGGAPGGG
ncbi:pyrroline-5-carboxylate reductase [Dorcoceras hygrometricum]|uniref:Pyrroline-5-carboxylate reductase n=1 Tax=Dorcoceras hygrometricum TaxID=472368 RepID=A0A2Z7B0Y8_9LAMI|nr:pyrroline-5-carboxylate reductase [Dorcoceras hygrometricum]